MLEDNFPIQLISEQIVIRILDQDSKLAFLNRLVQNAKLEKQLLNIQTYEEAIFIADLQKTKTTGLPEVDVILFVQPLSYSFILKISVSGIFHIKYKSANAGLPKQIKPFLAMYSGVVVDNDNKFEFKNEMLEIIENPAQE